MIWVLRAAAGLWLLLLFVLIIPLPAGLYFPVSRFWDAIGLHAAGRQALRRLASTVERRGDLEAAYELRKQIVASHQRHPDYFLPFDLAQLGFAEGQTGRPNEGLQSLQLAAAHTRTPGPLAKIRVPVLLGIASIQAHGGEIESARRTMAELGPGEEQRGKPQLRTRLMLMRGLVEARLGDANAAADTYRRAMDQRGIPSTVRAVILNNLADLSLKAGNLEEAERSLGSASQALGAGTDPLASSHVAGTRGELMLLTDRPEEALALFDDSLRLRSGFGGKEASKWPRVMRARALIRLGQIEAAKKELVAVGPNAADADARRVYALAVEELGDNVDCISEGGYETPQPPGSDRESLGAEKTATGNSPGAPVRPYPRGQAISVYVLSALAVVVLINPTLVTQLLSPGFTRGWGAVIFCVGVIIWLGFVRLRRSRQ